MFGFEKKRSTDRLVTRAEEVTKSNERAEYASFADLMKAVADGTFTSSDEQLAGDVLSYQEIRSHQESGNSAGLKDSEQLASLESSIESRARDLCLLK